MGLITPDDILEMIADADEIIDDNQTSISLRRGDITLDSQTVRIVRQGAMAAQKDSVSGQEVRGRILVLGTSSLDIQIDDRFNDVNGVLCVVRYVQPNRTVRTMAEAESIQ